MLPPRIGFIVASALALGACASLPGSSPPGSSTPELTCKAGEQPALQDSLHFGTAKPKGTVRPDEWADFLKGTVTPRFPQGLTTWQASGQWRSPDGALIREGSHVLNLLHPNDEPSEKAVQEIITAYKSRFQQETVLRVKTQACASL